MNAPLTISYKFDASQEELAQLPAIQVDAIWSRNLQERDARRRDDLALTSEHVEDFLARNPDYLVVLAYASDPKAPEKEQIVGYSLAAPYLHDDEKLNIDQFYALPHVKIDNVHYDLKPHKIGPNILRHLEREAYENYYDIITADALHGSEGVYLRAGYTKDDSNKMLVKTLMNT